MTENIQERGKKKKKVSYFQMPFQKMLRYPFKNMNREHGCIPAFSLSWAMLEKEKHH